MYISIGAPHRREGNRESPPGSIDPMLGTEPQAVFLTRLKFLARLRTQFMMSTTAAGWVVPATGNWEPGDDRGLPPGHGLLDFVCQLGMLPHEPPPPGVPDVVPVGGPPDMKAARATTAAGVVRGERGSSGGDTRRPEAGRRRGTAQSSSRSKALCGHWHRFVRSAEPRDEARRRHREDAPEDAVPGEYRPGITASDPGILRNSEPRPTPGGQAV
jgi:hypothetical protein